MKTQLLEDIGENTTESLAPSPTAGPSNPAGVAPEPSPAARTSPPRPRSALGVWRQGPAEAPQIALPQLPELPELPEQAPTPLDLNEVFEEIAALEAQYVPPVQQPAPAVAPAAPQPALHPVPAEPLQQPAPPVAPAAPQPAMHPVPAEPLRQPAPPVAPAAPQPALHPVPAEPLQQPAPAVAPAVPPPALHAIPAEPLHEPAIPPPAPRPLPQPAQPADIADTATVPRDPLFDFTLPSPELQETSPFTPPPGATGSRKRYLLWGAGLLSCAALVLGGGWLYQQSKDAGSPAPVASAAKVQPQAGKAVQPPALAAQAPAQAPAPVADTRAKSSESAEPASRPAPSVPPLVYLEPDRPAAARAEQPAPPAAVPAEPSPAPKPAAAAPKERVYPLPKRSIQKTRERAEPAARPAKPKAERTPARQVAHTSAARAEHQPSPDTSMEATLKACRAHGYHAAQCIKQGCSVTEYGFVCRGR